MELPLRAPGMQAGLTSGVGRVTTNTDQLHSVSLVAAGDSWSAKEKWEEKG